LPLRQNFLANIFSPEREKMVAADEKVDLTELQSTDEHSGFATAANRP
jgi:hypothetical protein